MTQGRESINVNDLVEIFGRSVKELRDAEDALIADHSLDNVDRLMRAVDRYWILREQLRALTRFADAVQRTP